MNDGGFAGSKEAEANLDCERLASQLTDWFHTEGHPLYRLMDDFVRVFHASYKGSGAHVLLLAEATDEIQSCLFQLENLLTSLFPNTIAHAKAEQAEDVAPAVLSVLQPMLFSRVYAVLYTLYMLATEVSYVRRPLPP